MSGWLHDVLDAYLSTVSEREFDAPFISYLTAAGFVDVHQLHGAYEFGKDFIGKRDGRQWAFQTKSGNLNMSSWRPVRSQVEEMLWNDIAHPAFDAAAPRTAVLVTTGRLTGAAAPDAQQFAATNRARGGEVDDETRLNFEVWDRDTLIFGLQSDPAITLDAWGQQPLRDLLGIIADTDRREIDRQRLERQTRSWVDQDPPRTSLAAAVVAQHLAASDRADLACSAAFALIRAGAVRGSAASIDTGRALFRVYAERVLQQLEPVALDPFALDRLGSEAPPGVSYAVRCQIAIETLGMLGLLEGVEGRADLGAVHADALAAFVTAQPGATHPLSDRWAMSIVPPALLLARTHRGTLQKWLERIVVWVCDHYDVDRPGLASSYASPSDELKYLLGEPYEHVDLHARRLSFLATVILDLAACLDLDGLYADAWNDFHAVGVAFPAIEVADKRGQYLMDGTDVAFSANVTFVNPDTYAVGWRRAPHHERSLESHDLDRQGRSWDLLAISLLLRDRHFISATRRIAGRQIDN